MGKLDGKIAVVTGGSAGIGLASAKLFASEGAKVIITGRDQEALDSAVRDIGHGIEALRSDITKMADVDALRDYVAERHGRVDVLFANAGGGRPRLFEEVSEDDFDFMINVNLKGSYFTAQKLLPMMSAGASIIFCTSTNGRQGRPYVSVYSASKAALRSLARTLAAELSPRGIRVNALAPGFTDTDLMRKSGMTDDAIAQAEAHAHAVIPLRRSGAPDEVARGALYLACDDSSYVTGIELDIDGGLGQIG